MRPRAPCAARHQGPSPPAAPGEERAHKPPSVEKKKKKKHHFSLGPSVHGAEQGGPGRRRSPAPRLSPGSSGGECGRGLKAPRPRGVGGNPAGWHGFPWVPRESWGWRGKGRGGWSGLGHVVLVEVRRYESIKNHLLPNSCGERGEERSEQCRAPIPPPQPPSPRPPTAAAPWHQLTCLSGAGPSLCPCPDAARAPGSAPGNSPRVDPRCGAGPGVAGCFHGIGWESAPEIGVFS